MIKSKLAVIRARPKSHQETWATVFAEGLKKHGWRTKIVTEFESCDMYVRWSARGLDVARNCCDKICVLERGYLGDRFQQTSVSFGGGLNGRAEFRGVLDCPNRFLTQFGHLLKPWRELSGCHALLIGQTPGDASLSGININAWYAQTVLNLKKLGYEVGFRPHPDRRGRGVTVPGIANIGGTLHEAFDWADFVITYNSNSGVESVLYGLPTVTADKGAMAWPVTSHVLRKVVKPDRLLWAAQLAWKQWGLEEIRSGYCWECVGKVNS
jgi:hypothetical protein